MHNIEKNLLVNKKTLDERILNILHHKDRHEHNFKGLP